MEKSSYARKTGFQGKTVIAPKKLTDNSFRCKNSLSILCKTKLLLSDIG